MSKFNEARLMLENAKTDKAMFKAASYIQKNSKALGLDYIDLEKLSDIGMHYLAQIERDLIFMQKNDKARRPQGK